MNSASEAGREYGSLDQLGYHVLPGVFEGELDRLRQRVDQLFELEGEQAGNEFKQEEGCLRLANLVDKDELFWTVVEWPSVLQWIGLVLGPEFKLSSLNARRVPPGSPRRQPLHADMSAVRDERGNWVCNTVWMLDDFTSENGALRVVPGSHRFGQLPQDALADPLAAHPRERLVTGTAGSVIVLNAHCWHGGVENRSLRPRTAIHAFYCRNDKPQQQYQKRLVRGEVQQRMPDSLRRLLALDDPENDRLSSEVTRRSGFLK